MVNPYDPIWKDYLKASWKQKQLRVWPHALSMLEPDEVKVSRPVLRGLGAGEGETIIFSINIKH
jgi:hypothetical protein